MTKTYFYGIGIMLCACQGGAFPEAAPPKTIAHPAPLGSCYPHLFAGRGSLHMSWIHAVDSATSALCYASFDGKRWGEAYTIAQGNNWFVNWADYPSLIHHESGYLAAHWLEKSSGGTYDYDIHIAISEQGNAWGRSFVPHQDGVPAEHGFVSMESMPHGQTLAIWLDGRNTKGHEHEGHEGHAGAMTLRSALFNAHGEVLSPLEIDARVCDCCQTDLAMSSRGPLAVYRDRSEEEVRDIYIARLEDNKWTAQPVHSDGWQIKGCPVNGPAIAAQGDTVAVAWYTEAGGNKALRLACSFDAGKTFAAPTTVASGNEVMGRTDVGLHKGEAVVVWMEKASDAQALVQCARFVPNGQILGTKVTVGETSTARASGFPVLACLEQIYVAYTYYDPTTKQSQVRLSSPYF